MRCLKIQANLSKILLLFYVHNFSELNPLICKPLQNALRMFIFDGVKSDVNVYVLWLESPAVFAS